MPLVSSKTRNHTIDDTEGLQVVNGYDDVGEAPNPFICKILPVFGWCRLIHSFIYTGVKIIQNIALPLL